MKTDRKTKNRWTIGPATALATAALAAILAGATGCSRPSGTHTDTLTVALTGKYPPFSFYDGNGELAGFDVDVARDIARRLDRSLVIVPTEWDGILVGLKGGKFDAIIGSMAVNRDRESQVDFSQPYYYSGAQLFIHERDRTKLRGIADCADRPIGVVAGETFQQFLDDRHPEVNVVAHTSTLEIFENLKLGRIDGFVSDLLVGTRQIEESQAPFTLVGPLLYRERMAIPVRKDNPALLQAINHALAAMKQDGALENIATLWLGAAGKQAVLEPATPSGYSAAAMTRGTIAALLLRGFAITLLVGTASLVLGFVAAVPLGAALNRGHGPLYFVTRGGVDFIRGTPVLVQLFFVHFGLPYVGITLQPLASAILTLSTNAAAYMSEVVRSGLMSVDHGQRLAGEALGLSRWHVFRLIIWPQAFRIAIPPLMNSVVALMKDTALIGIISVPEVLTTARSITAATFNPIYYFVVAIMFFMVTFPLMKLAGRLERRIKQKGFVHD